MDQEHDEEPAACERCGHTRQHQVPSSEPTDPGSVTAAVRRPPLIELTAPSGRVRYVINLN